MRILAILTLAAISFGFASCAKDKPAPPAPAPTDGKTVHKMHHHGK